MVMMLRKIGLTPDIAYYASIGSIALSLLLWFVPRSRDESGRPERLAIFVGLWPATLMLLGQALRSEERSPTQSRG